MMVSWLPAMLLTGDLGDLRWDRALTFDLGPQVSQVEGLLIKEMSRVFDVTLIFPEAPWVSLMQNTLRPYDDILDKPYRGDPHWQPTVKDHLEFGRFSTQLAEVKDAVATVRGWLDSGVRPQQICAGPRPTSKPTGPALRLYLEQEGVPACKPVTRAPWARFVEDGRSGRPVCAPRSKPCRRPTSRFTCSVARASRSCRSTTSRFCSPTCTTPSTWPAPNICSPRSRRPIRRG